MRQQKEPMPSVPEDAVIPEVSRPVDSHPSADSGVNRTSSDATQASEGYGPVRVRHRMKSPQDPLTRPDGSQHEDFAEMMHDLVPSLVDQMTLTLDRDDQIRLDHYITISD